MPSIRASRPATPASRGIVVAALAVAAGVTVAQTSLAEPQAPGRVIHLLVQTDPNMRPLEVGNKFVTARDATSGFNFADHAVVPVDPDSYLLLSSIVRRGTLATTPIQDDPAGVLIEPMKGQDGAWWLDFRDPSCFLESATVVVVDAETQKEEVLELKAAPRLEEETPLRFHSPGAYVLRLAKGKYPRSATLRVTTELADGEVSNPAEEKVSWPDVGRCYLVTLKGVTGDEQRLFESLQDPDKVGNPIKELFASTTTLIVGSFREKDPWLRPGFVSVTYLRPANTTPKRVWLRFPLTEFEEAAVRAELDVQLAPEDGFKKLPAWLAAQRLPAGEKLVPGVEKWVEIAWDPVERGFRIDVPVDTRAWKSLIAASPEKVGDRAILVWEFESQNKPEEREAIRVGGAAGKRYQVDRLGWWLTGLPMAPNED